MSTNNYQADNRLISTGIQAFIGFKLLKYVVWELVLISVLASIAAHSYMDWNYLTPGVVTFLACAVLLMFNLTSLLFTAAISIAWAALLLRISYWADGQHMLFGHVHHLINGHHDWMVILTVAAMAFIISALFHLYVIRLVRLAI